MINLNKEKAVLLPENANLADFHHSLDNIVVIAPHPDDEAIGVGGSIKLASEKGDNVFIIYVTTGSDTPAAGRRSAETVTKQRQAEAEKSLKTLGAVAGFFLHYESKEVCETKIDSVIQDIFSVLMLLRPKIIFTPSPFETHPTHLSVTQRTLEAIKRIPNFEVKLRGYQVWDDIFASDEMLEEVDISGVIDTKKRAIRAHESEIKFLPYDTATVGGNHYRAIFSKNDEKVEYVEKLLVMDEIAARPELELDVYTRNLALKHLHDLYENLIVAGTGEEEV